MLVFRHDTYDHLIWRDVYERNEYRLPDRMDGAVVIDVGAHIGAFASACKIRGAAEVWAVEQSDANLRLCMQNFAVTEGPGILQPFHAAAWRSDRRGVRTAFGGHDSLNTGGAWAVPYREDREEVPSLPFDDLVKLATDCYGRRISLLKLDCEGSEWPILYTSRLLHWIDSVCGEYHLGVVPHFGPERLTEGVEYTLASLRVLLRSAGFSWVEIEPPNVDLYAHFWARR